MGVSIPCRVKGYLSHDNAKPFRQNKHNNVIVTANARDDSENATCHHSSQFGVQAAQVTASIFSRQELILTYVL